MPPEQTVVLRPEEEADIPAIREVHRIAFGTELEAKLVDALREQNHLRLSLVAELDGQVVGHLALSELTIHAPQGPIAALALAPVAVLPAHQRQGIGTRLVRECIGAGRKLGYGIMLVLGHPEYYPRFGFSPELAQPLDAPYAGEAFMALELLPNALRGVTGKVEYARPFSQL